MPLSELKKYKGIKSKPHDPDEFWKDSLEELNKYSLEYELIPVWNVELEKQ